MKIYRVGKITRYIGMPNQKAMIRINVGMKEYHSVVIINEETVDWENTQITYSDYNIGSVIVLIEDTETYKFSVMTFEDFEEEYKGRINKLISLYSNREENAMKKLLSTVVYEREVLNEDG